MSFLFEKPLIVRIMQIVLAIAGILLVYVGIISMADFPFAITTMIIGAACLICGTILHLRRWYAWHFTLLLMLAVAGYMAICFIETNDMVWMMILGLDVVLIFSWIVKVTRQYFDATA